MKQTISPPRAADRPGRSRLRPGSGQGLLYLAATILLVLSGLIYFGLCPVGLRLDDEGYILALALRVWKGQQPYRDFFTLYPPPVYYLLAALFQWFGPSLLWSRYLTAATKVGIALATLTLGWRLRCGAWALLAPLLFLVSDLAETSPLIPYASWMAQLLVLVGCHAVISFIRSGRVVAVGGAAACCSLAFFFKQPIGGLAGVALAVWWLLDRRVTFPHSGIGLALLPTVSLALVLVFSLRLESLLFLAGPLLLLPLVHRLAGRPANACRTGRFGLGKEAGLLVLGLATPAALLFSIFAISLGWELTFTGVILRPLMEAGRRFRPEVALFFAHGATRGLLILGVSLALSLWGLLWPASRPRTRVSEARGIIFLLTLCSLLLVALYPWPSSLRVLWILCPFLVLLEWGVRRLSAVSLGKCAAAVSVLVLASLLAGWVAPGRATGWLHRAFDTAAGALSAEGAGRLPLERAPVYSKEPEARAIVQVARWVEENSRPHDPILVYPRGALVYFLTDRANPTPLENFTVRRLERAEEAALSRRIIEEAQVVIWVDPETTRRYPSQIIGNGLEENFREVSRVGRFALMKRRKVTHSEVLAPHPEGGSPP